MDNDKVWQFFEKQGINWNEKFVTTILVNYAMYFVVT